MKISFKSVSKNYGPIVALKDIDLTIEPGEFVFIVGPSGAGKSTIIKLILNQVHPTSGDITIGDTIINHRHQKFIESIRRQIGVIFQDYQLIPDKTVEENIALALDIISYPESQIANQIDKVVNQVNLGSRRHLFPSQLSGGELQRAALARALAIDPKIILADEPTGNLDPENSWNLVKILQDICLTNGTTVLMTTHNIDIIESLDKRVIAIKNGQIIKDSFLEKQPIATPPLKKKKIHAST